MAGSDEVRKMPTDSGEKRKLDAIQDPNMLYQHSKRSVHGDGRVRQNWPQGATVADEGDEDNDDVEGPEMPGDIVQEWDEDEDGRFFGGGVSRTTAQAIDFLDDIDGRDEVKQEQIDAAWVRKLSLAFEKKISKNAELRAKYPENPSKFMASEADLDAEIKSLSVLSEHPQLYPEFIRLNCAQSLASLLAHENVDIAIDAVEIVAELIDDDVANKAPEVWVALVEALAKADLLDLLYSNLQRLSETAEDDQTGIGHVISALAALAPRRPTTDLLATHPSILNWLAARAGRTDQTRLEAENTQATAEVLAILLQASPSARTRFVEIDGVDMCLQRLAAYRKGDPPHDSDEDEYAANILSMLIHALNTPTGPKAFLDLEGVELTVILLNSPGKVTRERAIRLIDYALSSLFATVPSPKSVLHTAVATQLSIRFVDNAGLKPLFTMLRKTKDAQSLEHVLAVVANLLRYLPVDSDARIRLLAKFVERNYGVLEKLVGLRQRYIGALQKHSQQDSQSGEIGIRSRREDDEDDLEEERREAYQYGLQVINTVLGWAGAEDEGMRNRITELLENGRATMTDIVKALQDQARDLGVSADPGDEESGSELPEDAARRAMAREERQQMHKILGELIKYLAEGGRYVRS